MRGMPNLPPDAPRVTLYGRPGCHLCEVAMLQLRALQQTIPFHIDYVSIEGDEALERRFMLEIPVVELAGEVVTQGAINLDAVRAAAIVARLGSAGQFPAQQ